ncbi:MAG: ABC transporter permease, partial [Chthoniobacteraceae bacterium]
MKGRHFREWSVAAVLGIVLVCLALSAPGFFQPRQLMAMVTDTAPILQLACGAALVILCRQIDIS